MAELDYGEWTGRSFLDLEHDPLWKQFNGHRSGTRVPGGESMFETQVRAVTELDRLHHRHPGGTVAVVSHAEWIRSALLHYLGMSLDLFQRLEISPASITTVDLSDWGATLRSMNAV